MSGDKVQVEYQKMYYGFPVILVSYYDEKGEPNMASMSSSFSLGHMVTLGFASSGNTIACIKEMREFIINIPDRSMMEQIEICGWTSGREQNKFTLSGLTPVQSDMVNAPRIAECSIHLDCRVENIICPEGTPQYTIVIADIVRRLLSPHLLHEDNSLNANLIDPAVYGGSQSAYVSLFRENTGRPPRFVLLTINIELGGSLLVHHGNLCAL